MAVRVLVVDDSRFFRRRLSEIIAAEQDLEVVATAENGEMAVEQAKALQPDVITMDVEMPVMDGITAVRRIMAARPTSILMLSSLTTEGAQATLDALDAGAVDFLPKRFEDISQDRREARQALTGRLRALGSQPLASAYTRSANSGQRPQPTARPGTPPPLRERPRRRDYRLLAIAASTGGPAALQQVLTALPANYALPVLVIQHMPAAFTGPFALRLDKICNVQVKEAQSGDALTPGRVLVAPGGCQLTVEGGQSQARVRVMDAGPGQNYKPSVDIALTSAAELLRGQVLAVVLTGMGADGCEGARLLKQMGATVWAQDEPTSVVYGMPMAVAQAGLVDQVLPLPEIGLQLARI